ncbi:MAG: hypothetical protein VYA30_16475 [Myxococcota bacterium]|nr:hypothetical protein [Myxococcota bacterium]
MRHLMRIFLMGGTLVCLWGCGSGGGSTQPPGTVTDIWSGFCTATFTVDYAIIDTFDDPLFTARAGETYLVNDFRRFGLEYRASLLYLTQSSPITFDVTASDETSFPFETNCASDSVSSLLGVFTDSIFYRDEALTDPICELSEGSIAEGLLNIRLVSGFGFGAGSAPAVYKVTLGEFSNDCDGAEDGYVQVRAVNRFGASYFEAPIARVLRPRTTP